MTWQPPASEPARLRPLAVGEIIDVSFRLYRENFLPMAKIAAIGVVPTQILSMFLLLSTIPDKEVVTGAFGQEFERTAPADAWTFFAGTIAIIVLGAVSSLIVSAAMTKAVAHAYVDGAKPDIAESLRLALRRLGPLLLLSLMVVLGMFAGLLTCGIGSVFLYVSWSVAAPVLIMENASAGKALSRSMQLIKGRWWPSFGLLILVSIMTSIATQIITTPISLAAGGGNGLFGGGLDPDTSLTSLFVGSTLAGIIAGIITTPFSAIAPVVLYVDQRVRNEGFDVQVLARRLGTEPTVSATTPPPPPYAAPPTAPPAAPSSTEPPTWGAAPPSSPPPE